MNTPQRPLIEFRLVKNIDIPVVPGQAGGGSFQKEKNYIERKNLPIECAQGDRPAQCPNHFFACAPLLLFHGGDVTCFDVMKLLAGPDEVMWLVVR